MLNVTLEDQGYRSAQGEAILTYMGDNGRKKFALPRIGKLIACLSQPGIEHWKRRKFGTQVVNEVYTGGMPTGFEDLESLLDDAEEGMRTALQLTGHEAQQRKRLFHENVRKFGTVDNAVLTEFFAEWELDVRCIWDFTVGSIDPTYAGQLDCLTRSPEGELVALDITIQSATASPDISTSDRLRAAAMAYAVGQSTNYGIPDVAMCLRFDEQGVWTDEVVASNRKELLEMVRVLSNLSNLYNFAQEEKKRAE